MLLCISSACRLCIIISNRDEDPIHPHKYASNSKDEAGREFTGVIQSLWSMLHVAVLGGVIDGVPLV